jgi:hypothetical protein
MGMRRRLTFVSVLLLLAATAEAAPAIFDDRNNNGVFDAGDVDITAIVTVDMTYATTESIVLGRYAGPKRWGIVMLLKAGKDIRVTGSFDPGYAGSIALIAKGTVRVSDGVTILSHSGIEIDAQDIVVGNNVLLTSTHGHAGGNHYSQIRLDASRNVQVGTRLRAIALYSVVLHADAGALAVGAGAVLQAPTVVLEAGVRIVADKVVMKAKEQIGVFGLRPGASVSLKGATGVVGRDGAIYIHAPGGSVDITGARFNVAPDIQAGSVGR